MGDEIADFGPTTECFPSTDEGTFSANDDCHWARQDGDDDIYDC